MGQSDRPIVTFVTMHYEYGSVKNKST